MLIDRIAFYRNALPPPDFDNRRIVNLTEKDGGHVKIVNIRITGGTVDRPNMGVNITINVKWTSSLGAI